jgi:hypothetical protein
MAEAEVVVANPEPEVLALKVSSSSLTSLLKKLLFLRQRALAHGRFRLIGAMPTTQSKFGAAAVAVQEEMLQQ